MPMSLSTKGSNPGELEGVEFIKSIINQYNKSTTPENHIHVIHGGTSDILELMGVTAIVSHLHASKIVTIPQTILPKRYLRKQYGIPLIEENHTLKKVNGNYKRLTLQQADHEGISACYHASANIKRLMKVNDVHRTITETILHMHARNYIRNFKKLMVLMTYMMLMDSEGKQKGQAYLSLLENERELLAKELRGKSDLILFDKYFSRIKNILSGNAIPFNADENFRSNIQQRYPILYCAIIDSDNKNSLDLQTVKIMFTPKEHVVKLKNKIEKMQLNVQVHGYTPPSLTPNLAKSPVEMHFVNANNLTDLRTVISANPQLLKSNDLIKNKITHLLHEHFYGDKDHHFAMATLLMKKATPEALTDLSDLLSKQLNFNLYEIMQTKGKLNKNYLHAIGEIVSTEYLTRMRDLSYLRSVLALRLNHDIENSDELFDYLSPTDKLNALLSPNLNNFKHRSLYLYEYILRLQHLYTICTEDVAENPETMLNHIQFIKNKYIEAVREYQQFSSLNAAIKDSDLYQQTRGLLREKNLILVFFLSALSSKK